MAFQEIFQEIDNTLDQLICNAEAITGIDLQEISPEEIEAFQKTQESLLQHLLHMDEFLASKQKTKPLDPRSASCRIFAKRQKFEQLKSNYNQTLAKKEPTCPILSKRRSKRLFDFRGRTHSAVKLISR